MKQVRLRFEQEYVDILDGLMGDNEGISSYADAIKYALRQLGTADDVEKFAVKVNAMSKDIATLLELTAGGFADADIKHLPERGGEELIQQATERVDRKIRRAQNMQTTGGRRWRT